MRRILLVLGFATLLPACTRKLTYADDIDASVLKSEFKCDGSASGERAKACRVIDDFAAAGPFEGAPAKGHEAWAGQLFCTDALDLATSINFAGVYLKPGVGAKSWPDDVKEDPSHDVAFGAHFGNQYVSNITPAAQKSEYVKVLEAAAKGAVPTFTDLAAFDRDRMDRFWAGLKKPPDMASRTYGRLVRSNGKSLLGNPFTSEAKLVPSATYFVRGNGSRMLVAYPSSKEPGAAPKPNVPSCVAELWKIYVE